MFEQLLFTWAPKGPIGPGFQPVAATARLADPHSDLAQAAVRFCRYARPAGLDDPATAPVSYGWANVGPDRVVFRRGYLGLDANGRPGNFYAHILVGPAAAAPAGELARRFDSAFWWRGEPVADYLARFGARFDAVRLADVAPGPLPEVGETDLVAFTDAVFGALGEVPVVLPHAPATVAELVGALSRRLPGALERLSVSTYEHLDTAAEFDIVGMGGSASVPAGAFIVAPRQTSGHALRARRVALSQQREDRHVVVMALATAGENGRPRLPLVVHQLGELSELAAGGSVDAALLARVLARPVAATALLQLDAGREAAAAALAEPDVAAWDALEASAPSLPPPLLCEFAAHLAQGVAQTTAHATAGSPQRQTLEFVIGRCAGMPEHFTIALVEGLVRANSATPERLAGLGGHSAVTMLAACARSGEVGRAAIDALLDAAPGACLAISDATELPELWRARALANRLAALPADTRPVLTRLADEPGLVAPFVWALRPPELLLGVLRGESPTTATELALRVVPWLADEERLRVLADTAARLKLAERLDFLAAAISADRPDPGCDELVASVAGELVIDRLDNRGAGLPADPRLLEVLERVPGPRCGDWLRVLDGSAQPEAALAAIGGVPPRYRPAAIEFVLAAFLCLAPDQPAVERLTRQLAEQFPFSDENIADLLMRACLSRSPEAPGTPLPYVVFLLDRVGAGRLPIRPKGQLRNEDLHGAAQQLVATLGKPERLAASRHALYLGGRARRWWNACRRPRR